MAFNKLKVDTAAQQYRKGVTKTNRDPLLTYSGTDFKNGANWALSNLDNEIYAAIIGYCEELEHDLTTIGNGHHLAQKITKLITDKLQ